MQEEDNGARALSETNREVNIFMAATLLSPRTVIAPLPSSASPIPAQLRTLRGVSARCAVSSGDRRARLQAGPTPLPTKYNGHSRSFTAHVQPLTLNTSSLPCDYRADCPPVANVRTAGLTAHAKVAMLIYRSFLPTSQLEPPSLVRACSRSVAVKAPVAKSF